MVMPLTNPAVRGSTRATWIDESRLRGMMLQLLKQFPNADREAILAKFLTKARRSSAMVDEGLTRIFDIDWRIIHRSMAREETKSEKVKRAAEQQRAIRRVSKTELTKANKLLVSLVLLDLVQPNGKKLRDCTGVECKSFGGWLTKIGDRVGGAIVGEKLNEAEVTAIWANNGNGKT
jgi:hypothetical protein